MCRRGWGGINIKRVSNVDARARTCMTSILVLASSISVLFFRFTAASLNIKIISDFLLEPLYIQQCCWSVKHLVRILIRGSCFVRHRLTSSQQKISFFAYCFLKIHSKIKSLKEFTKKRNQGFFYFFACWWKDPDSDPNPHKIMTDPYPGGPESHGSGSTALIFCP